MVLENFKKILRMKQADLKLTCLKYLLAKGYETEYGDGYVYGKGEIPVMLVAHMDTVHREIPYHIYYDNEQDVMWSPEGIGGDDRCGVYSIMKILEEYKPYVLFLEDEETGCIGATKATQKLEIPDINFMIELDRRGIHDCVFYECGNEEFQKYIESFGFKTAIGSFTDIVELSDAWDVASVNLSIGYFNEHTFSETIHIRLMENTISKVKKILDDVKRHPNEYFEYLPNYPYYEYEYDEESYNDWFKKKEEEDKKEDEIEELEKKLENEKTEKIIEEKLKELDNKEDKDELQKEKK